MQKERRIMEFEAAISSPAPQPRVYQDPWANEEMEEAAEKGHSEQVRRRSFGVIPHLSSRHLHDLFCFAAVGDMRLHERQIVSLAPGLSKD